MLSRSCDVSPKADQDAYTIALQDSEGWIGIDADLGAVIQHSVQAPPPQITADITSYHKGKGLERYAEGQFRFKNSSNGWRTTQGRFHATPLMEFAKGLRNEERNLPAGSGVKWVPLAGTELSLAVSLTVTTTFDAKQAFLWVRKGVPAGTTGSPSTLTVELVADAAGSPSTVTIRSATITVSDVTDTISVLQLFSFATTATVTATNTYWLKVYGQANDAVGKCWEVGCDPDTAGKGASTANGTYSAKTYSPYFRLTDTDVARQFRLINYRQAMYAFEQREDGAAGKVYLNGARGKGSTTGTTTTLVDTSGSVWGSGALPTGRFAGWKIKIIDGLGAGQIRTLETNGTQSFTVTQAWDIIPDSTSEYVVTGGLWFNGFATLPSALTHRITTTEKFVYMPAGDDTAFMVMGLDYTDADDHVFDSQTKTGTRGTAWALCAGYDASVGNVLWRANRNEGTGSSGNGSVCYSTNLPNAAYNTDITWKAGVVAGETGAQIQNIIFHENSLHVLKEDTLFLIQNNRPFQVQIGSEASPSVNNGTAYCTAADKNLYINRGAEVLIIAGANAIPTGLADGLPVGKSGYVADLMAIEGWVFAAMDAGDNTSGIYMWALDTSSWSNHLDAYAAGRRIRNLLWHPVETSHPELWCDMGGDLVRQQFPSNGVRPANDTTMKYHHEAVIELPAFDMSRVDFKYFSRLYANVKNLTKEGDTVAGQEIIVEAQYDDDIDTSNWQFVGKLTLNPTGEVRIDKGGKRNMVVRLRLLSSSATSPATLEATRVSLFYRQFLTSQWQIQFYLYDDDEQKALDVLDWLRRKAQTSEALTMRSTFRLYHDRQVTIISPPYYNLQDWSADGDEMEAMISLMVAEVA